MYKNKNVKHTDKRWTRLKLLGVGLVNNDTQRLSSANVPRSMRKKSLWILAAASSLAGFKERNIFLSPLFFANQSLQTNAHLKVEATTLLCIYIYMCTYYFMVCQEIILLCILAACKIFLNFQRKILQQCMINHWSIKCTKICWYSLFHTIWTYGMVQVGKNIWPNFDITTKKLANLPALGHSAVVAVIATGNSRYAFYVLWSKV